MFVRPCCSPTYLFADVYVRNAYLIAIKYALLHNTVYVNIYYVTIVLKPQYCVLLSTILVCFSYDINPQNPRCARKAVHDDCNECECECKRCDACRSKHSASGYYLSQQSASPARLRLSPCAWRACTSRTWRGWPPYSCTRPAPSAASRSARRSGRRPPARLPSTWTRSPR